MKCPTCKQDLILDREDTSYDLSKDDKEYNRRVYMCKTDDVWVTIEEPKEE